MIHNCNGQTWQADFEACRPTITGYYWKCLRRLHKGEELVELVHEAVCIYMEKFAKQWKHGKPFALRCDFILWHLYRGMRFVRKEHGREGSVRTESLPDSFEVHRKALRRKRKTYTTHDLRIDLSETSERTQEIAGLILAGFSWVEIGKRFGVRDTTARRWMERDLAHLFTT